MMMSITLRFIPTLMEETEKIMNAQKARGANFTEGGLIKRAKALIPILIPLFVSANDNGDYRKKCIAPCVRIDNNFFTKTFCTCGTDIVHAESFDHSCTDITGHTAERTESHYNYRKRNVI